MPSIIPGNFEGSSVTVTDEKFEYDYPEGLDLRPGSTLHQSLVTKILHRARESRNVMSRRYSSWNEIDQILTAFINISDEEAKVKRSDRRKPVSIIFPYSYAVQEVMLSYLVAAFLQEPYFRYEGVGPEDTIGAILMEGLINLHMLKTKVGLNIHTQLRDCLGYGIGVATPGWEVTMGKKIRKQETGFYSEFSKSFVAQRSDKILEDAMLFEGNKLENIDVYKWFPDPTVSASDVQNGEFCGWMVDSNYTKLRKEELSDPNIFNARYLGVKEHAGKRSQFSQDESDRELKYGGKAHVDISAVNKIDRLFMFVDLSPKEWELSDKTDPERWMFELCNDTIITQARPLNLAHGMYPVTVCAPDYDGYTSTPLSRLELLYGPQETIDWLLNSHIANVRKAINDMLVVDPYLVNINDLKDPEPGKLIRMRRPAWGKALTKEAVTQLGVNDITRANIQDVMFISQLMHKVAGADDSMAGMLRQGGPERLTKGEFQGTRAGSINRYERMAKVIGMQCFQDLGYMFAVHAQQFTDEETYVRAVGRWPEKLMKEYGVGPNDRVNVSPFDLLVNFDVLVRDGSIPGGNWNEAWIQLFQSISAQPALAQKFDIVRIFKHIARGLGAKNVDDFEIQTMPDDQVRNQVEAGNLQPVGQLAA